MPFAGGCGLDRIVSRDIGTLPSLGDQTMRVQAEMLIAVLIAFLCLQTESSAQMFGPRELGKPLKPRASRFGSGMERGPSGNFLGRSTADRGTTFQSRSRPEPTPQSWLPPEAYDLEPEMVPGYLEEQARRMAAAYQAQQRQLEQLYARQRPQQPTQAAVPPAMPTRPRSLSAAGHASTARFPATSTEIAWPGATNASELARSLVPWGSHADAIGTAGSLGQSGRKSAKVCPGTGSWSGRNAWSNRGCRTSRAEQIESGDTWRTHFSDSGGTSSRADLGNDSGRRGYSSGVGGHGGRSRTCRANGRHGTGRASDR